MARMTEGKETWHRLLEWDRGQAPAERLSAIILKVDGFENIDPSHPLGGRDGKKDIIFYDDKKNKWIGGVYFPRGQQSFSDIKEKFIDDFKGVDKNNAYGFAFITNQELRLGERQELNDVDKSIYIEIYHLERITSMLNTPTNYGVRLEFLDIEMSKEEQLAFFANISSLSVPKKSPSLIIKGITVDEINNDLFAYSKNWTDSEFMEKKEEEIQELYEKIVKIVVPDKDISTRKDKEVSTHKNDQYTALNELLKRDVFDVEVKDDIRNRIISYFDKINISLPTDFFLLGNLQKQKSLIPAAFGGLTYNLCGTEEEQKKYETIMDLYYKIFDYDDYHDYFSKLQEKFFVKCVLSNTGTTFDEDVDIKLMFPINHVCHPDNLPIPGYSSIEWFNRNSIVEVLFKLQPPVDVDEYSNYAPIIPYSMPNINMGLLLQGKSAEEEYKEHKDTYNDSIEQIFCYEYRKSRKFDIWSFNIPYIKQNINMSFPSILVFDKLPEYLEFEIRSKHLSNVINGKIPVIAEK